MTPHEYPSPLAERLDEFDLLIVENRKLAAIALIKEAAGVPLDQALDLLTRRYRELRVEDPHRFSCTHEAYWAGFYS